MPAEWTDSQLLGSGIVSAALTADQNISVRESGVLDATGTIHAAAGGSFTLAASAVVSPNLTSISEPILVQRERTIDVVVGTRQAEAGTIMVPQVNYVPTQVTEPAGTQTIRIGSVYRTMDVTLSQAGYYNGTERRNYFVEKSDYQNVPRSWNSAPVVPWSDYRVFADGTVQNITRNAASGGQTVPVPEAELTFTQLTDDQRSVVLDHLGYKRLFEFSFTNARAHQTINGNTTVIPWVPDWAGNSTRAVNPQVDGLRDKYVLLPTGAEDDFLRLVSQGAQSLQTAVGRYRDEADIRLTQTHSTLRDEVPNVDDFDDRDIGFDITSVSDSSHPYGVRSGTRSYEIYGSDNRPELSVQHLWAPFWHGGSSENQSIGFETVNGTPVGFITTQEVQNWINDGRSGAPATDRREIAITAPSGLAAGTAAFVNQQLIGTRNVAVGQRRIPDYKQVQSEVELTGGHPAVLWTPP